MISNFNRVINAVFFLLGDSSASEFLCTDVSEHCSIFIVGVKSPLMIFFNISNQDTILSYELMCGMKESFAILRVVVRGRAQRLDLVYLK